MLQSSLIPSLLTVATKPPEIHPTPQDGTRDWSSQNISPLVPNNQIFLIGETSSYRYNYDRISVAPITTTKVLRGN